MRAVFNGITIARSDETIVVEGSHYFPPDSVDPSALQRSWMKSPCYWKGIASYYHVEADGQRSRNAAWTYRHPPPWIRKIKHHIAFWNGVQVLPD
jgi:uncharacterized protein (DUF427 family)